MGKEVIDNPLNLQSSGVILPTIEWHRIIIDEFHELCTVDKYKNIMNIVKLFKSENHWCVTGTPFNKESNCLEMMVNFTSGFTNKHNDKVFMDSGVNKYLMTEFFRRNTKKSIESEYKLDKLDEKVIMLNFTNTERTMYNAFLANKLNDAQSVYLRKICCHPKLADEIKDLVANCKTLEDIEKVMLEHHEKDMNNALEKYNESKKRIIKTQFRLDKYIAHRKRRLLATKDYEGIVNDKYIDLNNNDDQEDDVPDNEKEVKINNRVYSNGKIEINSENDAKIMKIIGLKWEEQKITLQKKVEDVKEAEKTSENLRKEYEGKKTTYEYFKNSIEQVKKIYEKKNKEENKDGDDQDMDDEEETCCICLGEITSENIGITTCGHRFCHQCITEYLHKNSKCPYCRKELKDKNIFLVSYNKKEEIKTVDCSNKQLLINEVGTKLANLIYFLKNNDKHTIIFSQWDDLLVKVGEILTRYNINNVFCKGNVWTRDKAIRTFNNDDRVKVIMLSTEGAASGTNLTKATQVIILDPIIGPYEFRRNMEWQAIGRAYRMGQKNKVTIIRFVIRNTIEEEVYNNNKKDDELHKKDVQIFVTEE
jgi:SNF2 family DNA or RNA helicase